MSVDVSQAEGDAIGVGAGVGQWQAWASPTAQTISGSRPRAGRPSTISALPSTTTMPRRPAAAPPRAPPRPVAPAARAMSPVPPAQSTMSSPGCGIEPGRRGVLPQPVHAAAHQIVHQVVAGGDAIEDAAHQAGLFGRVDVAIAEGWRSWPRSWPAVLATPAAHASCNRRVARGRYQLGMVAMPELPEVETVRRGLEPVLAGRAARPRRGSARRPALSLPGGLRPAADRRAHRAPDAARANISSRRSTAARP